MWSQRPSFRFEIENFSTKKAAITSIPFVGGGCEWFLHIHPTGDGRSGDDHMSLYLYVANHKSLPVGWKRSARFYFVVLNQSDKELYRSSIARVGEFEQSSGFFCAEKLGWGYGKATPLSKLQALEKDVLIIEVYINDVEDGLSVQQLKKQRVKQES